MSDKKEPRLTRRQAAIIGAYTGITCGPFSDIHEYVDSLPGFSGIGVIGFTLPGVRERMREAATADFLALIYEPPTDAPPSG